MAAVLLLLALAVLCPTEDAFAELHAERISAANVGRLRVGGPDAIAGLGDWALGNGTVCAAIADTDHETILSPRGGVLVDLGHCGRGDDHFIVLQPLFNVSRRSVPPASTIRAEVNGEEARIVTQGSQSGIRFETVYAVDRAHPRRLRIATRLTRLEEGSRLSVFADAILQGTASLKAFTANVEQPELSVGFAHPHVDSNDTLSMLRGIQIADLQVLVGGDRPEPGIAYGVHLGPSRIERSGERELLPYVALNGPNFSLLGVFANPFRFGSGDEIGLLQLLQAPFMDLAVGERLVFERSVLVGGRADVASVTDQVWPDAPRVAGRIDDPAARLHVARVDGAPMTEVQPDPDGRFAFRLPAGRYELRAVTPDGRELEDAFRADAAGADLGTLQTGAPTRVVLPRGAPMRLVFLGVDGTPDPRFGDDGIELRFGERTLPTSLETNWIFLAGVADDPALVAVPAGRYRVLATRGLEFGVTETRLEVAAGETAQLSIEPPPRALDTPGWIAADLHVHAEPSDDSTFPLRRRLASFVAEGAEILVASDHDRITDYGPLIRELGLAGEMASVVGVEVTTTVHGSATPKTAGHYNVFPMRRDPLAYRDGTPMHEDRRLRRVIADLRARDAGHLVQLNHPRGGRRSRDSTFFSHLSIGKALDPTLPLHRVPNRALVEPDPESGLRDLDFDAMELLNGSSMHAYRRVRADWLSLLLQGEFRAATANSDTHTGHHAAALPRNYVRMPEDRVEAFDPRAFTEAVRAGHSFGTTGPFLEVDLDGAGPGEHHSGQRGELRVAVRAAPWVPVSKARVFANGVLVEERAIRAGAELRVPLRFERDAFVTVEVEGEADETYAALAPRFTPFAFSNPIFVDADGDGAWSAPGLPIPPPPAITTPFSV
jgi:hypothetical protein